MTGPGRFQFGGSHGKSQALTVEFRWKKALHALQAYAKRHDTLVVDGRTNQTAIMSFKTRGVDAISVPDWTPNNDGAMKTVMIYELLAENNEQGDEWIYVLQERANRDDPNNAATLAVQAAVAGDFGEALEKLKNIDESTLTSSSTLSFLRQKCENCFAANLGADKFSCFCDMRK